MASVCSWSCTVRMMARSICCVFSASPWPSLGQALQALRHHAGLRHRRHHVRHHAQREGRAQQAQRLRTHAVALFGTSLPSAVGSALLFLVSKRPVSTCAQWYRRGPYSSLMRPPKGSRGRECTMPRVEFSLLL